MFIKMFFNVSCLNPDKNVKINNIWNMNTLLSIFFMYKIIKLFFYGNVKEPASLPAEVVVNVNKGQPTA